jgi:hypothetical protein
MESPNLAASIVMFGWLPVVLLIFSMMRAQRAVIVSFLIAWLFLPMAQFHLPGITAYTYSKMATTSGGVLLAVIILDSGYLLASTSFPSLVDVPMIVWCLCPMATAIANMPDLTMRDGAAWTFSTVVEWGLPYLIGRLYLADFKGMKELAIAVFVGGLIYVPLCLFEMKFSPILHLELYGFTQHSVAQQIRWGGWRPMVFMQHGIAVGFFMTSASLAGLWLWYSGALRQVLGIPVALFLPILWTTTIFCRSTGALILLAAGTAVILLTRWLRTSLLIFALALLPPLYVASRTIAQWNGEGLTDISRKYVGGDRSESLEFRFDNEKMIVDRSMKRPLFGWGGYARAFPLDDVGHTAWVPDSLWIVTFGTYGAVGLVALLMLQAPVLVLLVRLRSAVWRNPQASGVAVFAVLLLLFAIDNMLNAMPNPIFILGLGGMSGLAAARIRQRNISFVPRDRDLRSAAAMISA